MTGVDLIFKVAAIGRDDQAMMTTIAGLIVVLLMVIQEISNLFTTIKDIFGL